MTVSALTSTSSAWATSAASRTPASGPGRMPDADGDGGGRVRHGHHGGGGMAQDLMQALKSLGVSMPQPPQGAPGGAGGPPPPPDGDGDDGTQAASTAIAGGTSDVRQAFGAFMSALFDAARSASSSSPSSTSASGEGSPVGATAHEGGHDPRAAFSSDLGTLISQISNGTAPGALQQAFDGLMSSLGVGSSGTGGSDSTDGSSSASSGTSSGSTAASSSPTLQQLLTTLQTQVGYGPPSQAAGMGNLLNVNV